MCCPADILVHRKVDLHEAEVRTFEEDFVTFVLGIPKFLQMTQKILDILT